MIRDFIDMTPTLAALLATTHHIIAFALFACLMVEWALLRVPLTLGNAQIIRKADLIYGITAGLLLVVGLVRVYCAEKGADYYWHSAPFMIKVGLFAVVGALSLIPTLEFLKWGKTVRNGVVPVLPASRLKYLQLILNVELLGLLGILLCAPLAAKGIGYLG